MIDLAELLKSDNFTPFYAEYGSPAINRNEILRYSGIPAYDLKQYSKDTDISLINALKERCERCATKCDYTVSLSTDHKCPELSEAAAVNELLDETLNLCINGFTYRLMYCYVNLSNLDKTPLYNTFINSKNLSKNLENCRGVILFAATVGSNIDMLIRRFERTKPATALMLQAIGAERVESLCDMFNDEVTELAKALSINTHPRFSPGYGDLAISVQAPILNMLNAEKRLGITLSNSFLMAPSKSVTAIIGLE